MEKSLAISRFRILSGSALKLIAVVAMFIDHAGKLIAPEFSFCTMPLFTLLGKEITVYYILREIGRLAFPIYCFLLGEGLAHTRDRRRYLLALLVFAVLSEVPFDLMIGGKLFYTAKQNVFVTLFLGGLLICIYESAKDLPRQFLGMMAVVVAALFLKADYGLPGAALILLMYVFRSQPVLQTVLSYPLLSGGVAAFAAFLPIRMYNGQRGFIRSGPAKYFFYLFYPVHMLMLVWLKLWLRSL